MKNQLRIIVLTVGLLGSIGLRGAAASIKELPNTYDQYLLDNQQEIDEFKRNSHSNEVDMLNILLNLIEDAYKDGDRQPDRSRKFPPYLMQAFADVRSILDNAKSKRKCDEKLPDLLDQAHQYLLDKKQEIAFFKRIASFDEVNELNDYLHTIEEEYEYRAMYPNRCNPVSVSVIQAFADVRSILDAAKSRRNVGAQHVFSLVPSKNWEEIRSLIEDGVVDVNASLPNTDQVGLTDRESLLYQVASKKFIQDEYPDEQYELIKFLLEKGAQLLDGELAYIVRNLTKSCARDMDVLGRLINSGARITQRAIQRFIASARLALLNTYISQLDPNSDHAREAKEWLNDAELEEQQQAKELSRQERVRQAEQQRAEAKRKQEQAQQEEQLALQHQALAQQEATRKAVALEQARIAQQEKELAGYEKRKKELEELQTVRQEQARVLAQYGKKLLTPSDLLPLQQPEAAAVPLVRSVAPVVSAVAAPVASSAATMAPSASAPAQSPWQPIAWPTPVAAAPSRQPSGFVPTTQDPFAIFTQPSSQASAQRNAWQDFDVLARPTAPASMSVPTPASVASPAVTMAWPAPVAAAVSPQPAAVAVPSVRSVTPAVSAVAGLVDDAIDRAHNFVLSHRAEIAQLEGKYRTAALKLIQEISEAKKSPAALRNDQGVQARIAKVQQTLEQILAMPKQ